MRTTVLWLCLSLVLVALPACGTHDIWVSTDYAGRGFSSKLVHHGFLWGWIGGDIEVDGNAITYAEVEFHPILDFFPRLVTLGIYWPTRVRVTYTQDIREDQGGGGPDPDDPRFYPEDRRRR